MGTQRVCRVIEKRCIVSYMSLWVDWNVGSKAGKGIIRADEETGGRGWW